MQVKQTIMKDFVVLFLVVVVNISQGCPWLPAHYYLVGREGELDQHNPPNSQKPLPSNLHKPHQQSKGSDKDLSYSQLLLRQNVAPVTAPPKTEDLASRQAELDEIDKEALSMISEEDRQLLLTELSSDDRKALLLEYEDSEVIPVDETRFGALGAGGFAGLGAKIGAGAGSFLGGRLAGSLGAKLGAAAGAYLGAAAARRLEATFRGTVNNRGNNIPQQVYQNPNIQYGTNYGGGYGTYVVNQ